VLAPDRVTVPVPVLSNPTAPPRTAETVPDCTSKAEVLVSVPVPVMDPDCSDTLATVSLKV